MTVSLSSCYIQGLNCSLVAIESHISNGLPAFNIVGLADASIQESKERVRSALINSGFEFPSNHKTINLAPAHLKKHGALFDLPIAVALLMASGQVEIEDYNNVLVAGELSLDGSVKSITGALIIADFAQKQGFKKIILPLANLREAGNIQNINIVGISHLDQLRNLAQLANYRPDNINGAQKSLPNTQPQPDFADIKGQECAKRALVIAAAGRHHVLMHGPPGCGKTLLAQTLPSILPELSFDEKIEISQIYSLKGMLTTGIPLIERRPFRAVHSTASAISVIGGGQYPTPGEISLAHKGILFMDEIAEFPRAVLEILRQPLEGGRINVSRAAFHYTFPASFQLIAAMNPCPCGYFNHPTKPCKCTNHQIEAYNKKISGPLKDRIDICLQLEPVKDFSNQKTPSSAFLKARVQKAVLIQKKRFASEGISFNSELNQPMIKKYVRLTPTAKKILNHALSKLNISMREYTKILKLALTIADLDGHEKIGEEQLVEALSYRQI